MKLKKCALAWVVVKDLKKALSYYTDVLGLKLLEHHPEFGWAELGPAEEGGALLGVAEATSEDPDAKPGQNAVMTFSVDNLDDAIRTLSKQGAHFIGSVLEIPGAVKMQTFVDLDGNTFQLVETLR